MSLCQEGATPVKGHAAVGPIFKANLSSVIGGWMEWVGLGWSGRGIDLAVDYLILELSDKRLWMNM